MNYEALENIVGGSASSDLDDDVTVEASVISDIMDELEDDDDLGDLVTTASSTDDSSEDLEFDSLLED